MNSRPDLLVVGLGPAGGRAAWAAARRGLDVVAIDRKPPVGAPAQCAEFVPLLLDQELGGLDAITAQRVDAMATMIGDETERTPGFAGRMLDRAELDVELARRAADAGADCRFGLSVRRIDRTGAVSLSDGATLWPRAIVGADGPRSAVGRAIGAANRDLVETRQARVALLEPFDATDIYLSADYVGGYGWLFPKGGAANLGIGVAPAHRARLKSLLDALHARLARAGRVGTRVECLTGGAIPVGGVVGPEGTLGDVPVMLAGDAAGLAHPVTGGGIAPAVLSGAMAGEAAAAWLAGDVRAVDDYGEEIDALYGAPYARALRRRRELVSTPAPDRAALRRGWIAFPEYWAA